MLLLLVIFILLYVAVRPEFVPYLIGTADGMAHKYRLVNFDAALSQGVVHPRWIGNAVLGYGAPLYIFNYAVPYYIVDVFYRVTSNIQVSSQLYAASTIILSFFAMYLVTKNLWGTWAGVVSAAVYTFAPYHLFTVYSYEGWGEMLAFAFPPFILYCLMQSISAKKHRKLWYTASVISWVLFINTHNISSFISSPIILLIAFFVSKRDKPSVFLLFKTFCIAVLIASFFIIPAITLTTTIKIPALLTKEMQLRSDYMVPFIKQMITSWSVMWGQHITYQEFTVGIPIAVTGVIGAVMFATAQKLKRTATVPIAVLLTFVFFVLLTDPITNSLYAFRPLDYVLYPYRFLFVATFAGSLLAGFVWKKFSMPAVLFLVVTLLFGIPFTHPYLEIFPFPQAYFAKPQMLGYAVPTLKTMGVAEFLPESASVPFLVSEEKKYLDTGMLPQKFLLPSSTGTVITSHASQESLSANVSATTPTVLTVSTLYYPDWRAAVDGKQIALTRDNVGRMTVPVDRGTHIVTLWFGYSITEIIGIIISVVGMVLFGITIAV